MIRFETEQTIARSADDVWTYAADILRHPDWMGVTDARILHGQGSEVGARGRERLVLGPFRWDVDFEVTEAVPGRRIVWRSVARAPRDGSAHRRGAIMSNPEGFHNPTSREAGTRGRI